MEVRTDKSLGMEEEEFFDEVPSTRLAEGKDGIKVQMINCNLDPDDCIETIYQMVMSTWGDAIKQNVDINNKRRVVEMGLQGGTLRNALESVNFTFAISGISRATTHQIVRTRVGAGYAQQGGRDNDWRHHDVRIPRTICQNNEAKELFQKAVNACKEAYAYAVDHGIMFQDARFILPIGTTTHIIETINYSALQGLMANRLCYNMQWEINHVAALMKAEVCNWNYMFGKYLMPRCEIVGKCTYSAHLMEPCGKFPFKDNEYKYSREANGSFKD